jgi:hypothetical protein
MQSGNSDIPEELDMQTSCELRLGELQCLTREFENVELLQNLQLLLGVKFHNILLRIVFELLLSLLESKPHIVEHFRNTFTIDILLKIFEDYHDHDLKLSAIDTINQLCKGDSSGEIIFLFRKLGGT